MKCVKCGVDLAKTDDVCAACYEYDTRDYVIVDSKLPRVVALEKELAEARAEAAECKEIVYDVFDFFFGRGHLHEAGLDDLNGAKKLLEELQAQGFPEVVPVSKLKEARAEIERLKDCICYANKTNQSCDFPKLQKQKELIEQMKESIRFSLSADEIRHTGNFCASAINDACETSRVKRIAALEAAERGK